jgi:hypothetical protein
MSIAAHDQHVRASVVRRVEQQDAGTPARLGGDVAVFRGDAVPGKMVKNRWDVAVVAIADRDHEDAIGGDQKRQRGGKGSHGLRRTVPRKRDIFAWARRCLRRREQHRAAGVGQNRLNGIAGSLVHNARRAAEDNKIEEAGAGRYEAGRITGCLTLAEGRTAISGRCHMCKILMRQIVSSCDFLE